jgi:hypothetical protein
MHAALFAHLQACSAPAQASTSIENFSHSMRSKIDSLEFCLRLLSAIEWDKFWTGLTPSLPQGLAVSRMEDGIFLIHLNARDARAFVVILVEHLASNAKNVTDVLAGLLNDLWSLRLSAPQTNLENVYKVILQRNSSHPLAALFAPLVTGRTSWLAVSREVRNQSQHRDATQILKSDFGRACAPYLSRDLLPTIDESERSLEVFCPRPVNRVYQFMEEASSALCALPSL